jgi:hypothetical protein
VDRHFLDVKSFGFGLNFTASVVCGVLFVCCWFWFSFVSIDSDGFGCCSLPADVVFVNVLVVDEIAAVWLNLK